MALCPQEPAEQVVPRDAEVGRVDWHLRRGGQGRHQGQAEAALPVGYVRTYTPPPTSGVGKQGRVARFFLVPHIETRKMYQLTKNVQKGHKI
jgi:hypothetical protein